MPLTAIALNCTLKSGKEQPSTDKLLGEVLDELMKHDVSGEIVRVADHTIKPGVTSDEGDGDEWPALRQKIIAADIFVLASRREPFGLVLAEARAAGMAVIGSAVDGIPEVLEDGRAGILVPPDDPAALSRALGALLADPGELARWRNRATSDLAWLHTERMCQETCAVYEDALAAAPRRTRRGRTLGVGVQLPPRGP